MSLPSQSGTTPWWGSGDREQPLCHAAPHQRWQRHRPRGCRGHHPHHNYCRHDHHHLLPCNGSHKHRPPQLDRHRRGRQPTSGSHRPTSTSPWTTRTAAPKDGRGIVGDIIYGHGGGGLIYFYIFLVSSLI
ncbi:hypothetical protein D1007_17139 [Hordeum vulgare]|nr:hypothetical protein D1007_17139 [Hordeum vulgare]